MNKIKVRLRGYIPKSAYVRGVGILAGGTAISQLIAIAILPLLTRLYSPQDFSALAVYVSITGLVTVVSCLRLEIAIPIPQKQEQAKQLLVLSLLSVFFITIISYCAIVLFSEPIHTITQDRLRGYLWAIPVGSMLAGLYASFQYWSTRQKDFGLITKTRMTQAVSGAGAQLGLGYFGVAPLGLFIGHMLTLGAGAWGLARNYHKKNGCLLLDRDITAAELRYTLREYDKFPKYSTLEALSNAAAIQVPVLIIATYAVGSEVGFLMLATRLLSAPMGLIGGAVAQVYLAQGPVQHQQGTLRDFTVVTVKSLAKVGLPVMMLAGISAPFLVPIVFGQEWLRSGVVIAWVAPWFFVQFISSPVSMALHITGNQKAALALQVFGFLFRSGFVLLSGLYLNQYMVEIYALTGLLFYAVYILVIFRILRKC